MRGGFTFNGWYSNPSFTGSQTASIASGSTGNRSFYARWTVIEFSIQYFLNGGINATGAPSTFTVENDLISLPIPTRHGHTFMGWYTTSNFLGSPVTSINAGSTGNRSFFARWELQVFTVTFFVDGVVFTAIQVPFGSVLADVSLVNPATGQAVGLFANAEHTTEFDTTQGIYGATTIFATSSFSVQVQLTRVVRGVETTAMMSYNSLLDNLPTPTATGYDFMGWYYDNAFTRRVHASDRITGNTTIYARFVAVPVQEDNSIWDWLTWVLVGAGGLLVIGLVTGVIKIKRKRGK